MRGDRRSSSFRKEKPAGLSRALSWLSVSTLSRQSRRIFHSQNELHAVHHRHTHSYSHTHLHAADKDEGGDDDNWVYQPQHKITGFDRLGRVEQQREGERGEERRGEERRGEEGKKEENQERVKTRERNCCCCFLWLNGDLSEEPCSV
ncbi:NHS-like protein 1 [Nibea albiflora]|uniref:NHS-like protein 1 n=1 Tax=Nibea albiflora TaxID=240163 RepID=A0ACB7FA22_NIBAL|nr:NHS-like protein 1 [Nibea albiflora]